MIARVKHMSLYLFMNNLSWRGTCCAEHTQELDTVCFRLLLAG